MAGGWDIRFVNAVEILPKQNPHPEYSPEIIKIKDVTWNQDMVDFRVDYYKNQNKYIFHFNKQLAKEIGTLDLSKDPLEQLASEVKYIKRMYERGIGAKEYYPFTQIEN